MTGILISELHAEKYRADQIYSRLYKNPNIGFDEITNIPNNLRAKLNERFTIKKITAVRKFISDIDGTKKYLFEYEDGIRVESVLMQYKHGYSACLSTQAGCRMGCGFCASATGGLKRNLTPSEILLQIMYINTDENIRISNIVLMGMGEPLDNYENTVGFLRLVNSKDTLNIGYRHISLSTCGLCDKIDALGNENIPLTLSVSLHAPNNNIRNKLMPVNRKYDIEKLMTSCKNYISKTNRRISFEYALINGVNDSGANAEELAGLLKNMLCHVNLIPLNDVLNKNLEKSNKIAIKKFQNILELNRVNSTVRRTLGADIKASCGQLNSINNY